MEIYNISSDYVMFRPVRTMAQARHGLLSVGHSPLWGWGIDQLESFDFRRREILHKNVEIFAVGKIAEFARFAGGERRKSPDRFSFIYPGRRRGYC